MRPISWGALFGGVTISLAFQLLMTLLAIGLGLNFLGGQNSGSDANAIGLGAGLWWGIVYLAIGGAFGGILNVVGRSVSAAGNALQPMVTQVANTSGISPGNLDAQAQELLKPSNGTKLSAEQARVQLAGDLKTYLAGGSNTTQARTDIVNLMSSQLASLRNRPHSGWTNGRRNSIRQRIR
jgi:hypothetical protein